MKERKKESDAEIEMDRCCGFEHDDAREVWKIWKPFSSSFLEKVVNRRDSNHRRSDAGHFPKKEIFDKGVNFWNSKFEAIDIESKILKKLKYRWRV